MEELEPLRTELPREWTELPLEWKDQKLSNHKNSVEGFDVQDSIKTQAMQE